MVYNAGESLSVIFADRIIADAQVIADYYRQYVITGKGAFVIVANGVVDFARAIRKKLVQEIT